MRADIAPRVDVPDEEPFSAGGRGCLEVRGASVRYGSNVAIDQVDLTVRPGEILGLVGPNGAGKTTLLDAICGMTSSRGAVRLASTDLSRLSPRQRAIAGIGRTFQSVELFDDMTVLDNIRTAAEARSWNHYVVDLARPRPAPLPNVARTAIADLELADQLDRVPAELPAGRRRLVGIARALASAPRALLLDEPAAGLNDEESRELGMLIKHVAQRWQLPVLLVEHDIALVSEICDRVVVLNFGRILADAAPASALTNPLVASAYLGADVTSSDPKPPDDPVTNLARP